MKIDINQVSFTEVEVEVKEEKCSPPPSRKFTPIALHLLALRQCQLENKARQFNRTWHKSHQTVDKETIEVAFIISLAPEMV